MITLKRPLILASGSPRRKEILDTMGIAFSVDVSDVDESCVGSPEEMVMTLSERKARAVAKKYQGELVLAADTLVFGSEVLGKPNTPENAKQMLRKLSGNWHSVYTGLTLIDTVTGTCICRADQTRVHFMDMSDDDIAAYVTRDPVFSYGRDPRRNNFFFAVSDFPHNDLYCPYYFYNSLQVLFR